MTGLMRCSKTASSFDQVVHGTGTGHSRNGTLWNFGGLDVRLAHSGLMLAERITLPHFSVSSPINLRKSVGEPASGGPPKSASRALILASANEALISSLSRSTISAGVVLGDSPPVTGLITRHEVGHGGHLRQYLRTRCRGNREGTHPLSLDVFD